MKEFAQVLARLGLTQQSIADVAYHAVLDDVERLQQIIDHANSARNGVLREMDRRRDSLARRARQAIDQAEEAIDAEFEESPTPGS